MAFLVPLAALAIQAASGVAVSAAAWIGAAFSAGVGFLQSTKKPKQAERAAQSVTIQMGESPRQAVLGKAWTAGTFVFGFNSGAKNIDEWILVKLADHPINDYEGFLIGEEYYGFAGDGAQPSFTVGGTAHLNMYFLDGTQTTVPSAVLSAAGSKWNADWIMAGCAGVWINYRANPKVWPSGRPSFRHYLGGAKVYDPRHDSTVEGGSGSQRINDYSTYVYSENLVVLALNYRLGIYNGTSRTHLMVGRGLSLEQALGTTGQTLAEYIAAANVADEAVDLKAGGTQLRYQGGLVIASNENYVDVLDKFAKGCGGVVVPRAGRLTIQTGASVTPHDGFTDSDLVSGEPIEFAPFLPETERVNTVIATYAGLEQRGQDASVIRRQYSDLEDDSPDATPRPYEISLPLDAVLDNARAQRISEIWRRLGRYERRVTLTLPPRFANVETGDWIPWTSGYLLSGDTVMFRVEKTEKRVNWAQRVTLREIADAAYDWDADTDELDPGQQVPEPQEIADLEVASFAVSAVTLNGIPAIKATWTAPAAVAATRMIIQVREEGTTDPTTVYVDNTTIAAGTVTFTNGVGADMNMEVRARYDSADESRVTPWTSWLDVSTEGLIAGDSVKPIGDTNRIRNSALRRKAGWGVLYNPSGLAISVDDVGELDGYRFYKVVFTATAANQVVSIGTILADMPIIVTPGERLSVQCLEDTQGPCAQSDLVAQFADEDNTPISGVSVFTDLGTAVFPAKMEGFADVPSTGRRGWLELYYTTSGAGTCTLAISQAMVAGASAAQTVHPGYTDVIDVDPDTATRVEDLEAAVDTIATSAIRIGNGLYGSDTTLSGTSWITLNSAAVTGIPAGYAVTFDSAAIDSGAGVNHMSAAGTILGEWDISHEPTSGGTPVTLFSGTFSATMPATGEPTDLELTGAGNPAAVLLTYTGDVTFKLRMKRVSGPSSNTNLKGAFRGMAVP